jgi:hypothetical protein
MSDWFIYSQILKLDIADIAVDYIDSIGFLNFELSAPLMLPVEAKKQWKWQCTHCASSR